MITADEARKEADHSVRHRKDAAVHWVRHHLEYLDGRIRAVSARGLREFCYKPDVMAEIGVQATKAAPGTKAPAYVLKDIVIELRRQLGQLGYRTSFVCEMLTVIWNDQ